MPERSKTEEEDRGNRDTLTDLLRTGAQQLIAQALKAEVADLLATYADQRDEQGACTSRPQWPAAQASHSDGHWAGHGASAQSPESPR